MTIDFNEPVERRGSGSLKWDLFRENDILPFWVADMDFKSCPEILHALHERIDHGVFGYTLPGEGLINAVVDYLERAHGITIEREWIVWVPGLVPALQMVSRLSGGPGQNLMTNTPVYYPFLSAHRISGMDLNPVPLKSTGPPENPRYLMDFEAMEKAVTQGTRLFLLCNPHNPTGRVFTGEELAELSSFCLKHDLILCSDEIHCDLVLEPKTHRHRSALGFEGSIRDRTITLLAASKTYNIPGLANAYAVIPDSKLRTRFMKQLTAHGGFISEPNCLGYHGTEAAYRHGEPWRQALIVYLRENRNLLIDYVRQHLSPLKIGDLEATYLAWIDARELGVSSPAAHLKSHGVFLSDGALFGSPGFVRFNFGCRRTVMMEGLERMKKAVDAIGN